MVHHLHTYSIYCIRLGFFDRIFHLNILRSTLMSYMKTVDPCRLHSVYFQIPKKFLSTISPKKKQEASKYESYVQ